MGIANSIEKNVNTIENTSLVIERIINPNIWIGVSKMGETIKINDNYYPLVKTIKYSNKIDYEFDQNIFLTIEKTNEIDSKFNKNILSYKINYGSKIEMGKLPIIYKTINMNTPNLDAIESLQ